MEGSKFMQEAATNAFYANACEMVSEDIRDFQECLELNTLSGRMKDEYETFKCYLDFKYAILERNEIGMGCEDGIELMRLTRDILLELCDKRDILNIKGVCPHYCSTNEAWGWEVIYKQTKEQQ